jgi:hypothetical protein
MKHLKLFEGFAQASDEVRMMAWLYFLGDSYRDSGLEFKSWENDKRMDGMIVRNAMRDLVKSGLAKAYPTKWKITPKGEKTVDEYFLKGSEDEAIKASKDLKKYDRGGYDYYPISRIPIDLFTRHAKSLRKYKNSETLTQQDYDFIKNFIDRYERDIIHDLSRMKKYVGRADELCEDKDYVLYRGVNISNDEHDSVKVGGKFKSGNQAVQSWTTRKSIAVQFSLGNPTPMQVSVDNNRFEDRFGVVLKHVFPAKQIVIDLVYINEMNPELKGSMAFDEDEVLVLAGKNTEYEIVEIHDERGEINPHF